METATIKRSEKTGLPTTGSHVGDALVCVGAVAVIAAIATKFKWVKF